jgi:hypothetical protein
MGGQIRLLHAGSHSLEAIISSNEGQQPIRMSGFTNTISSNPMMIAHKPITASDWVEKNKNRLFKYAGKYVAVTCTGVVAQAKDFDDVYIRAKQQGVFNPLVFKVPQKSQRLKIVSVKMH